MHGLDHGELNRAGIHIAAGELTGQLDQGGGQGVGHVKDVVQRVVDHLDQADQQDQLDKGGDQIGEGVVLFPFVQLLSLLGDPVLVPEKVGLDVVQLRGQPDDLDTVVLDPDGHRQQDHLGHQGEQQNCQGVAAYRVVTKVHDIAQRDTEPMHDRTHNCCSLLYFFGSDHQFFHLDGFLAGAGILLFLLFRNVSEGEVQGQRIVL